MSVTRVGQWDVVHWNPRRNNLPRPLRRLPVGRRVNNFGDLLGPQITARMLRGNEFLRPSRERHRLLVVGSIMHLARDGDVVWGAGLNGKVADELHTFRRLDVRAVRGPLTARWLESRGIRVPAVYGDPALLLPTLYPEFSRLREDKRFALTLIPNLHDFVFWQGHEATIHPQGEINSVLERIVRSERVIASSLHGIILAEAFGVPVWRVTSHVEPDLKYRDYYEGTGRPFRPAFETLDAALRSKSEADRDPLAHWSAQALMQAFPAGGSGDQDKKS